MHVGSTYVAEVVQLSGRALAETTMPHACWLCRLAGHQSSSFLSSLTCSCSCSTDHGRVGVGRVRAPPLTREACRAWIRGPICEMIIRAHGIAALLAHGEIQAMRVISPQGLPQRGLRARTSEAFCAFYRLGTSVAEFAYNKAFVLPPSCRRNRKPSAQLNFDPSPLNRSFKFAKTRRYDH